MRFGVLGRLELTQALARYHESVTLADLGDTRHDMGDVSGARRAWQDALAIRDDLGHPGTGELRAKITDTRQRHQGTSFSGIPAR
jgi:hypothetical protein